MGGGAAMKGNAERSLTGRLLNNSRAAICNGAGVSLDRYFCYLSKMPISPTEFLAPAGPIARRLANFVA